MVRRPKSAVQSKHGPVERERDVRLVAVIPAHGREPLLAQTVKRLLTRQTKPLHNVVVVGWTPSERDAVVKAGGVFAKYENDPLGKKWQHGIDVARKIGGTDILIMGSSDWVSDNWCKIMTDEMLKGYDLVGKRDIYFLDVQKNNVKRLKFWAGYDIEVVPWRKGEPIGAGRVISNEILEKTDWNMFTPNINVSLDWSTYQIILKAGGLVQCVETDKAYGMSISCYKWSNMHKWFDDGDKIRQDMRHLGLNISISANTIRNKKQPRRDDNRQVDAVLKRWFPDAVDIFGENPSQKIPVVPRAHGARRPLNANALYRPRRRVNQ